MEVDLATLGERILERRPSSLIQEYDASLAVEADSDTLSPSTGHMTGQIQTTGQILAHSCELNFITLIGVRRVVGGGGGLRHPLPAESEGSLRDPAGTWATRCLSWTDSVGGLTFTFNASWHCLSDPIDTPQVNALPGFEIYTQLPTSILCNTPLPASIFCCS